MKMRSPAADPQPHAPPAGRSGCRSVGRIAAFGMLSLAGCAAVTVIVLLIAGWVATQFGPGGLFSEVRPGTRAPEFEADTLDGAHVRLADLRGRPVALNFWATWCPPCVHELPMLVDAERRHADVGFVVVAMNAGQTVEHLEWFLEQQGIEIPVALDPGRAIYGLYGVVGLPTTVWIDGGGIVRAVELGVLTPELIDRYVARLQVTGE